MNWDEKKIVLNYFQVLYLNEKKYGDFVILNEIYAKNKAIKKYDSMSSIERAIICNKILHN